MFKYVINKHTVRALLSDHFVTIPFDWLPVANCPTMYQDQQEYTTVWSPTAVNVHQLMNMLKCLLLINQSRQFLLGNPSQLSD